MADNFEFVHAQVEVGSTKNNQWSFVSPVTELKTGAAASLDNGVGFKPIYAAYISNDDVHVLVSGASDEVHFGQVVEGRFHRAGSCAGGIRPDNLGRVSLPVDGEPTFVRLERKSPRSSLAHMLTVRKV